MYIIEKICQAYDFNQFVGQKSGLSSQDYNLILYKGDRIRGEVIPVPVIDLVPSKSTPISYKEAVMQISLLSGTEEYQLLNENFHKRGWDFFNSEIRIVKQYPVDCYHELVNLGMLRQAKVDDIKYLSECLNDFKNSKHHPVSLLRPKALQKYFMLTDPYVRVKNWLNDEYVYLVLYKTFHDPLRDAITNFSFLVREFIRINEPFLAVKAGIMFFDLIKNYYIPEKYNYRQQLGDVQKHLDGIGFSMN